MASAGTVTLELDANSVKLLRELQKTQKQTKGAAKGMQKSFGDAFTQIRRGVDTTVKTFGGLAIAATAATAAIFKGATTAAREIRVLSQTANTNAQEFQRMAFGAEQFGISQEKLSDILKDTTDRVGDFIQTGGGPMADFFENIAPRVGVTAEQFSKLSGKDALQLYVSTLEAANLSQSDMVFYMEAIASDSTRLLPLLTRNGESMGSFADQADRLGIVLDDIELGQLEAANIELKNAFTILESARNQIAIGVAPAVSMLAQEFVNTAQQAGGMTNYINDGLRGVAKMFAWVGDVFRGWHLIIASLRAAFAQMFEWIMARAMLTVDAFERTINSVIDNVNSLIFHLNKIPGVNIDFIGLKAFKLRDDLRTAFGDAEASTSYFENELHKLANTPMPTDQVDAFFDGVKQKSYEAGQAINQVLSPSTDMDSGGGDTGNQGYWEKWLASAENALTSADEMAKNTIETFTTGFGQAFESMIFDSKSLADSMNNLFEGIARTVVRSLGQMAAEWLAYKLVQLAVGKTTAVAGAAGMIAIAQAQSLQAGLNAFASTAAIPIVGPAAAPAAMATALAVTQPIAASIGALSLAGMAHDGIDSVPREGTWLLDKGERVYTEGQAQKIDQMSAAIQRMSEKPTSIGFTFERSNDDDVRQSLRRNSGLITSLVRQALYEEGKRI